MALKQPILSQSSMAIPWSLRKFRISIDWMGSREGEFAWLSGGFSVALNFDFSAPELVSARSQVNFPPSPPLLSDIDRDKWIFMAMIPATTSHRAMSMIFPLRYRRRPFSIFTFITTIFPPATAEKFGDSEHAERVTCREIRARYRRRKSFNTNIRQSIKRLKCSASQLIEIRETIPTLFIIQHYLCAAWQERMLAVYVGVFTTDSNAYLARQKEAKR